MLPSNKPYPVMNFLKNLYRNFGFLIVFFITLPLGLLANEPIDRSKAYQDLRDEMSALSQRISEIKLENQRRIQQLKAITIDVAEKEEAPPKAQELILRDQDFTREIINRNDQNKIVTENVLQPEAGLSKLGIYILPFYAIYQSKDFHLKSPFLGELEIEQDLGYSLGVRLGKRWKYFFIETDFNYFHEEFERLSEIPFSLIGETSTLAGIFSAGVNIPVNDKVSFLFGGGIGSAYQKVEFDLMGLSLPEKNTQLSYQFISAMHLNPIPNWMIGLRYRWMQLGEMDIYTERQLHAFEISTGYEW
jgi:opacity protein-like surface antigen